MTPRTGGLLLGLGALFLFAGSASAKAPGPVPPPTPPPPPKPRPVAAPTPAPAATADHGFGFFNYSTGEAVDPSSFLNWAPHATTPAAAPAPAPAKVALPKTGEKWQMIWSVNRPLSFLEMSAAKTAFRSYMSDQSLDSVFQTAGPPTTVAVSSTFTKDATHPIPVGQVIRKSDIVATLSSARRTG